MSSISSFLPVCCSSGASPAGGPEQKVLIKQKPPQIDIKPFESALSKQIQTLYNRNRLVYSMAHLPRSQCGYISTRLAGWLLWHQTEVMKTKAKVFAERFAADGEYGGAPNLLAAARLLTRTVHQSNDSPDDWKQHDGLEIIDAFLKNTLLQGQVSLYQTLLSFNASLRAGEGDIELVRKAFEKAKKSFKTQRALSYGQLPRLQRRYQVALEALDQELLSFQQKNPAN